MRGDMLAGTPVDFSHGDVDAFTPTPGAFEAFADAVTAGGRQAYTEYRGAAAIRAELAKRLADFTGAPVSAENGLILTRSEEHTSELQSLMRISYAVFCLKKKNNK